MENPFKAPHPITKEQNPHLKAERFFVLLRQRGDLWRELRSSFTLEEGSKHLKNGQAHELLETLKMRRGKNVSPVKERFAKRVAASPEKKAQLDEMEVEIRALLADPEVHEAIHEMRHSRVKASQESRQVMNEYRDLHAIVDELSVQDFDILRQESISTSDRKELERNEALRIEVGLRLRTLMESPETARAARIGELLSYCDELRKDHYAMTPSRKELADQIRSLWARGEAVMLTGSTGTGKTELFSHLTKQLYGKPLSRLIRSTQNVTPAEIFGKMGLRATPEGGTETFFQPGVYTDAIDNGMPFIIDEFNMLETKIRFGLKEFYNRRPGQSVVMQEDSGKAHVIQEGFVIGATANVKGDKHKERFELDAAETRVFANRKVGFLPKEEIYDLFLAQLMTDRGEVRMALDDARETLPRLLEAAELSQQAYEGKQTQFYAEGGGVKKTLAALEKAVLDPGRVLKIISGWPREEARGKDFRGYLEREILHVIQTEDYPEKDRRLLLQIFVTKGFFNGKTAEELGVPGVDAVKLKAWGWSETPKPLLKTQILSLTQVADLDPFGLRKLRASEAADEFLSDESEDMRMAMQALQHIDLSKLPPKAQKLLEQKTGPNVILAEAKDGSELRFDLQEIRREWAAFYRIHDLDDLANELPVSIKLTPEQIDLLKQKAKEGYTRAILIPANAEQHLQILKEKLTDGYEKNPDGTPIKTYLADYDDKKGVASSFPNQIETTDPRRKGKAYLLLTNPNESLAPNTKSKSADELIAEFNAKGLSGLTLAEHLIEERKHFEETGKHLVDGSKEWTWLLASRDAASRVLDARWHPGDHQVDVCSLPSGDRSPDLGARSSVVLEL
ncbi:AAA family ATPase [Patescibacteria group bacterium]|nr:AAA family ATPase [Patescibacteria group bacterium]